jgi:hypothetical protein
MSGYETPNVIFLEAWKLRLLWHAQTEACGELEDDPEDSETK